MGLIVDGVHELGYRVSSPRVGNGNVPTPVGNAYLGNGNVPIPVGGTYRGLGSSMFNATDIAAEDWQRQEQSNALAREFNAREAQKNRDWQEYMSNTSYQRMVADMKKAGINPIMAFGSSGADVGQGSTASSGITRNQAQENDDLSSLLKIAAGLIVKFLL